MRNLLQRELFANCSYRRNIYSTFTFKPSVPLNTAILSNFKESIESIKHDVEGFVPAITWHVISRQAIESMQKNGGSAISMSLRPDDGPLIIANIGFSWTSASDDAKVNGLVKSILEYSESKAKKANAWHPFKYVNYISEFQNPVEGFGEEGLNWLRKVQIELDPLGTFRRDGLNNGAYDLYMQTEFIGKDPIKDEL
jgi:hypothetical protein